MQGWIDFTISQEWFTIQKYFNSVLTFLFVDILHLMWMRLLVWMQGDLFSALQSHLL